VTKVIRRDLLRRAAVALPFVWPKEPAMAGKTIVVILPLDARRAVLLRLGAFEGMFD